MQKHSKNRNNRSLSAALLSFLFLIQWMAPAISWAADTAAETAAMESQEAATEPTPPDEVRPSTESVPPQEPATPVDNPVSSEEATDESSDSTESAYEQTSALPIEEQGTATTTSPGNVTVDFKDADIQNVLRILSLKSGVNIVAGNDVSGTVTLRLVDVPWEKALDVVLKTYGYAYDRDGNIIRVTTIENLRKEELATEVYILNYTQANEIDKALKDVLSERGRVRADQRSNTVIVTDMPTTLQRISKVVERLDRQTPQVVIEAKVIETTLGDSERLGIKWNTKVALQGSMRPTTFPFTTNTMSHDNKNLLPFYPEGRGNQTGTFIGDGGTSAVNTQDFPSSGDKSPLHWPFFPVADKTDFAFGKMDFSEFQAVLELIKQREDAKVLSEPHIIALNNQQAKILVGEVIALPTFERNSTTGRMEITGYKERDLGIRMTVVPQINQQDEVVVNIHPEITTLLGYDDLTTDVKAPRFSTREAITQVRIKSGQTIAIGGLIKEDIVNFTTKFPLLGDVPLLDKFFKHENKQVKKTDLLFFLTVRIVKEDVVPIPAGHKL